MRWSAFCDARAWPLVTSYSIHDLAATCGIGTPCARTAAGAAASTMAAAMAAGAKADERRVVARFSMFLFSDSKKVARGWSGWRRAGLTGPTH
ncbi:hypothetical protein D3C72_939040 [compost metagenome]